MRAGVRVEAAVGGREEGAKVGGLRFLRLRPGA